MKKQQVQSGRVAKKESALGRTRYFYVTTMFTKPITAAVLMGPIVTTTVTLNPVAFTFWTKQKTKLTKSDFETPARQVLSADDNASFQCTSLIAMKISKAQYQQMSTQIRQGGEKIDEGCFLYQHE